MAYASGKFAKALCDRCAFEYKLNELKEEWNGAKVCPDCYEPKHPQLEPLTATADPEALYKPRPNNDLEEGEGFVVVISASIFTSNFMNPSTLPTKFTTPKMIASLGKVTITTS